MEDEKKTCVDLLYDEIEEIPDIRKRNKMKRLLYEGLIKRKKVTTSFYMLFIGLFAGLLCFIILQHIIILKQQEEIDLIFMKVIEKIPDNAKNSPQTPSQSHKKGTFKLI